MPTVQEVYNELKEKHPEALELYRIFFKLTSEEKLQTISTLLSTFIIQEVIEDKQEFMLEQIFKAVSESIKMKFTKVKCSMCDNLIKVPEEFKDLIHICKDCTGDKDEL